MKNGGRRLRADTHVHFHACFDEGRFLAAAALNLAVGDDDPDSIQGALCLTETSDARWFERLKAIQSGKEAGIAGWRIEETGEENSVIAADEQGKKFAIIAGRQIVCRERLEVLALGFGQSFEDGRPIRDVMADVDSHGALVVLPWGFGKWTGRRKTIVNELLSDPPCRFVLGDNAGRLAGTREPGPFAEAASMGMPVLPGTDPFPFAWDGDRVGSFGLEWEGGLDPARPFQSLKPLLSDSSSGSVRFGELERIPGFLRNQTAIQIRSILSKWQK